MNLAQSLKPLIDGDVITDDATRAEFSIDKSAFRVMPKVVVFPKHAADVTAIVRYAMGAKNISVTARSGGTDVGGGPLGDSIILGFTKYFNHIVEIGSDFAVVEPGVFYRDFETETLRHDLLLPSFPASRSICALGGMISNNSGGEKTLAYGKTADYVQEMHMVLSDGKEYTIRPLSRAQLERKINEQSFEGRLYHKIFSLIDENFELIKKARPRVTKNSAGYALWDVWNGETFDLTRLFVGAQGTLGIMTQARVRLITPKLHSKMLVLFLTDIHQIPSVVAEVLQHKPETFEAYDKSVMKIIFKFFPKFVKKMGGNIFKMAWQFLPELKVILLSLRIPEFVLVAEFTGDDESEITMNLEAARTGATKLKIKTHVTQSDEESNKYHAIRRDSFALLQEHVHGKQTVTFIDDLIVRPEFLPEFIPALKKLLDEHRLDYSIIGHIGDGNLHVIPLMRLADPRTPRIIEDLTRRVNELVFKFDGSITAEHNDGLIRTPFLAEMFGAKVYALFEETKKIFDPHGIFNPGKKVDGDFKYSLDHLKRG